MGLFNFLGISDKPIDFSEDNVENLTKIIDDLGDTLIKASFGFYVDHLSQIRLASERHDSVYLKKLVICAELFGGSGAMWEIWIKDDELRREFNIYFCQFVDILKKMGIKDGRIDQVRRGFQPNGDD